MSTRSAGNVAEQRAAEMLERRGYTILMRNYRCRLGEVNLIAEDGDVLCFVEVRSRTTSRYGEAIETIGAAKRRHIALTAHHFLVTNHLEHRVCRFDVVTIQGSADPELLKDAFHLDE